MTASYREINYTLRPAKSVERRMLVELFHRLGAFEDVHNYQYIGFGSIYFSDFLLFHRTVGFTEMISIEHARSVTEKDRIELNRPYGFIQTIFGESTSLLPTIDVSTKRTIAWFDYDGIFSKTALDDFFIFLSRARSGSICIASYNIQDNLPPPGVTTGKTPEERIKDTIGESNEVLLPQNWKALLQGKDRALLFASMLFNQAAEVIRKRNGEMSAEEKLFVKPIINIYYKDGAQMGSFGVVICNEREQAQYNAASFESLPFYTSVDKFFEIQVPNLTFQEVRHLDRNYGSAAKSAWHPIPETDAKKYWGLYRYFPHFVETEL